MGGVKPSLKVIDAGPASSFQDAGRFDFLNFGVAPAGPCDPVLHAVANCLVGNDQDATTIEYTFRGDTYEIAASSCRIAVAGNFVVEIDGKRVEAWRTHTLHKGQKLSVLYATQGVRGYLAIEGGFDLEPVLGSNSTHARSGIGPLHGTVLKSGDAVPLCLSEVMVGAGEQEFDQSILPPSASELRVVWGPQADYFESRDLAALGTATFTVTPKSDRMGCQVRGPKINYSRVVPLISEGVALGSVQVPGDGLFIIALMDRQTVGGYPKIATIIGPDVREIAQARSGAQFQFRAIDVDEARMHARARRELFDRIRLHIGPLRRVDINSEYLLSVNLISGVYSP